MNDEKHSEITVRRASHNDIEGLISNRMDFIYSLKGIRAPKIFEDWTYDFLKVHLEDGTFVAWIAEIDKKIVSACMLCITQQIPTPICRNGKYGYIYNVFTLEEYRKRGIATVLIKKVQDYAIENEILALCLTATEEGCSVYEKQGFHPEKRAMIWNIAACPSSH